MAAKKSRSAVSGSEPVQPVGDIAKLSRPRLFGVFHRERLFHHLDQLRQHQVVWVVAPPGAGKTTLVASYIEARRERGIWYQLDAGDADISAFFFYLSEAARTLAPTAPPLPLFTPEYLPDLTGFAQRYFRALFARMPKRASLVLDNFQDVGSNSAFHQAILAGLSEVPHGRNLIVVSREEPTGHYTRGIASGAIARLPWSDLRLSYEETRAICAARQALPESSVRALHESSEGWPAGLVLMLERANPDAPADQRIGMDSREVVFDYFASTFLNNTPPGDQRVIMLLSVAPTLTATTAVRVTGDERAPEVLDDLYRRQLLVQRLHGSEATYRFHSLFRAFLQSRARALMSAAEIDAAKLRAASCLQAAGDAEHAFTLYAEAQQWDECNHIVLLNAQRLFSEGRWRTLIDWIETLPHAVATSDAWLAYWLGLSQFQVNQALSRTTLTAAFEQFQDGDDELGQMLTAASILIGYYLEYADWEHAEPWIFRLGNLLERKPTFPTPEVEMTVYSGMLYGIAIRRPDHALLPACIERTVALIERDLQSNARMLAGLAITGPVACMLGDFRLFYRVRRMLLPLLEDENLTELNRAAWHMTNGAKLSLAGESEGTFEELERGAQLSAQYNLRQIEFLCHTFANIHASSYLDLERAKTSLQAMQQTVNRARPLEHLHLLLGEGMYETLVGNFDAAVQRHKEALVAAQEVGGAAHRLVDYVFQCGALVLAGHVDEAEALAQAGLDYARECKVETWSATYVFVLAWCHYERGNVLEAERVLAQAIDAGDDGSYRYFRWLLQGCRKILGVALQRGVRTQSVLKIIKHFKYNCPDPMLEQWPWPVKVRTLGRYEIEVDGALLRHGRKTPKLLLSLLQYIIAAGGRDIAETRIIDALWPDAEGDKGRERLKLSLHRLRELLGDSDAILFGGGKVNLNHERVWVDALSMMRAREHLDATRFRAIALSVYHGDFLADEAEQAWMLPTRNRLRQLHAEAIRLTTLAESETKKTSASV